MYSRLFLFNPTNEMAIANGQVSYMPPRHLSKFENDLSTLPWILGDENDFVLVPDKATHSLRHLSKTDWPTPRVVSRPEDIPQAARGKLMFEPWGWSPAVYRAFKPFMKWAHPDWPEHPFSNWDPSHEQLLSRDTGYHLLDILKKNHPETNNEHSSLFLPPRPRVITKENELGTILKEEIPPLLIKTPWSASGRGLFRIRDQRDEPSQSNWVKGMLRRQGKLYVEKTLDKIQDISFQFWITKDTVQYKGHNFFYSDIKGQFAGCAIGKPENSNPQFNDELFVNAAIAEAAQHIEEGLKVMHPQLNYTGPAGVDGIFFLDEKGGLKLQPCLEINLRHNMGLANIKLKRHIHEEAKGLWKTEPFKNQSWADFCRSMEQDHPPVFEDGKIRQGFLPITSPNENNLFGVWLLLD